MGPKKVKEMFNENSWRTSIEEAPLDSDTWKVKVIVIEAAGSDQDRIYLNKFEIFAAEEKRFVIKNICKTETTFMVNQLGGEKKVKDDNLRVFEEGQSFLKDKKDIPPDIQALIIKHLILKMKDEYLFIKRQRLEVKEGMKRESSTMIDKTEVRGTISEKPSQPIDLPPPPKGKEKKGEREPSDQTPEPTEGKKYNTLLRVRGEEWRDKVYVDDYPTDGPNLYVAVTGFVDPYLPSCLIKIGIPLTAIVQIRIDPTVAKVPSSLFRSTKRGQSQTEILTEKSLNFWEDLQQLRINISSANDFKNTAFIVFTPPYWNTENLSGNPDKIYDELCYLMYDIQDLSRQHINYLQNMDVINIPKDKEDERYKKCYQHLINDLPLESITIYSVLDSILQSVSKYQELIEKSSKSSLSTALTLNDVNTSNKRAEKAEILVKDVFNNLCKTESDKKSYRITYGEEYENHRDPIIINYGDFAKETTFHLGNINLDNIIWSSLFGMPINNLWKNQYAPQGEIEAKISFHINVLLSCFDRVDLETAELNRLIHILSCRKLYNNRSSLKKRHLPSSTISDFKKVYLKRSVFATPLSKRHSTLQNSSTTTAPSFPSITKNENILSVPYPYESEIRRIKRLFDCPDLSELVSAAEIANNKPFNHIIDDYEFFEDFSGINAFQIMLDAFNKYNCVDYKYCELTDSIVLMFYNSHDKDSIAREEWRSHLPTPLCLQDFFDFVLEEHYDWIQKEEQLYDEHMVLKTQSIYKDLINPFSFKSCVADNEVEMELLIEGSLKYQDVSQIELTPESTETKFTSSKKTTTISPSSTQPDSKSSRKTKSSSPSTAKHLRQSFLTCLTDSADSTEIPKKSFTGYNLGERRVEVVGRDSTFFSKDGTRVSSYYTLIIPSNSEYIILKLIPGNGKNEFWFHRAIGEYVTPEIRDICESFRITSKDKVMINITKQSYQVPLPTLSISTTETPKYKERTLKVTSDKLNTLRPIYETRCFHSFYFTLPNGLITESIYEKNSLLLSHIKQYYVISLPHIDENMRCISLNGEVIIFRKSGEIEVLRPDSSYIKITKYESKIVTTDVINDIHSETSSDKSKKGKSKDKTKEKPSKTSSKASRNDLSDDDKISEIRSPEIELNIEEFEYISANGLRQKWINGVAFDTEWLLIRTATDYCLREIFSRRMDGTNILLNKDGVQVVTFPNNTRIITTYIVEDEEIYPEWTKEEMEYFDLFDIDTIETDTIKSKMSISQKSYLGNYNYNSSVASSMSRKVEEEDINENGRSDGYISVHIIITIEHTNFTTVTINKENNKVSVYSPDGTKVAVDTLNHYDMSLDKATSAKFDGHNLSVNYEACNECQSNTTCTIKVNSYDKSSVTKIHQNWLKMTDSFLKKIVVNEEGNINIIDESCSKELLKTEEVAIDDDIVGQTEYVCDKSTDLKSETSVASHAKCREMYIAKTMKFFILQRDLSCSELVHRALLDEYKQSCRWQPWCSINQYDTFGDHRRLLTILTPVHVTETEKWLMDSKFADKPKYLIYKDLRKDTGKDFYHWMRPYERCQPKPKKPDNVIPSRLPKAFVLRTLEQQWREEERENLKGAKELLHAILRYRHLIESDSETILNIPILDPRPEDERRTDYIVQALAHRIYEDLKTRLAKDVQSRAKADITTNPSAAINQISIQGDLEEESTEELKSSEEERENMMREIEKAEEMSPKLKRYWRRRAEEYRDEQFYQYLLREGNVPPYFRNILGGAIWWEMNNAANDAMAHAERQKLKCICASNEGTSKADESTS
ncbi:sperm-associated antigen 17-like [Achroia grisella]|uniref:sperm-associated antigen 17-like n=1 Tax=Achroia grisella TaxID=688607 RepID=UPI0027D22D92|nr:sperm-associated antigen 17-like [Achroia grisella]